jgi:hypothetical protein
MGTALCLSCGGLKGNPLKPCGTCGHIPRDPDDAAKHVLVEAMNLTPEQMTAAQDLIRRGGELEFDPDSLMTARGALVADRPDAHWFLFYALIVAIPLIAVAVYFIVKALSR